MQPISRTSEHFRNPAVARIENSGHKSPTENELQIFRHNDNNEFSSDNVDSNIQANTEASEYPGVGSRGTDVLILQQQLADEGHSPGPVDGIFGQQTLSGLQDFQREQLDQLRESRNGAPPAGRGRLNSQIIGLEQEIKDQVAGPATQQQLTRIDRDAGIRGEAPSEIGVGERGQRVLDAQVLLESAGHSPGPVDAIFGSQTLGAAQAYQQERIDSLEATVAGYPPIQVQAQLREQINALKDEQSRAVVGEETLSQLQAVNRTVGDDTTDIVPGTEIPGTDAPDTDNVPVDEPVSANPEEPDLATLDIPDSGDLGEVTDAVLEGEIGEALEQALNSEGDSVDLTLGARGSLPPGIPGVSVGLEGEFGVGVERVDDGYEVSISSEVATSLGLEVNDNLGVEAGAGVRSEVVYKFDTVEEAEQAIYDLAITAGNSPQLDQAVDLADDATRITNNVIDDLGDLIDNLPFGLGSKVAGVIDDIADGAIDSLPDSIGLFGRGIDLRPYKERLTEVDALRARAEDLVSEFNTRQNEAQGNLDAARDRVELTGTVSVNGNLKVPLPVDVPGLGLGAAAGVDTSVTAIFNEDGSITVKAAHTRNLSVEGGAGVSAELATEGGVTVSTTFKPDGEGGYRRDGDIQVEFRGDASAVAKTGVGLTENTGVGGEFTYTVGAEEFSGDVQRAASEFLQGDFEGALGELGSIEGDLTVQGRAISGAEYGFGGSLLGASLGAGGEFLVEDQGEAQEIENLSLEEAFEFLTTQVSDSIDAFNAVPA